MERDGRKTLQQWGRIKLYYAGEDLERRRNTDQKEYVSSKEKLLPDGKVMGNVGEETPDIDYIETAEPLMPGGLPLVELPTIPQSEEKPEVSEEETEI